MHQFRLRKLREQNETSAAMASVLEEVAAAIIRRRCEEDSEIIYPPEVGEGEAERRGQMIEELSSSWRRSKAMHALQTASHSMPCLVQNGEMAQSSVKDMVIE